MVKTTTKVDRFQMLKDEDGNVVEDKKEDVKDFMLKVDRAKSQEEEWVETTSEIIGHFNPLGMGINPATGRENEYFCYRGVKVCAYGQKDRIMNEINYPINKKLHGEQEADTLGTA